MVQSASTDAEEGNSRNSKMQENEDQADETTDQPLLGEQVDGKSSPIIERKDKYKIKVKIIKKKIKINKFERIFYHLSLKKHLNC